MEQLIAHVNYLIREKLWCSIRELTDSVSRSTIGISSLLTDLCSAIGA